MPLIVTPGGGFAPFPSPPSAPATPSGGDDVWTFARADSADAVQVAKYLAKADGDMANALAAALREHASVTHLHLQLPPGRFRMSRMLTEADGLRVSNLLITGSGETAGTELYEDAAVSGHDFFRWTDEGVDHANIVLSRVDLTMANITANFGYAAWTMYRGVNCHLLDCGIRATLGASTQDSTRWHVALRGVDCSMQRNRWAYAQGVLGGVAVVRNARFWHNVCERANDLMLSCVGAGGSVIAGCSVLGNYCYGLAGAGGLFVGGDGDGADVLMSDVKISDNQAWGDLTSPFGAGFTNTGTAWIVVVPGSVNKGISITDNVGRFTGPQTRFPCGIRVLTGLGAVEQLAVKNNVIESGAVPPNTQNAVEIFALADDADIDGNQISGPRGLEIRNLRNSRISRNSLAGGANLVIRSVSGRAMTDLDLEHNRVRNVGARAVAGNPALDFTGGANITARLSHNFFETDATADVSTCRVVNMTGGATVTVRRAHNRIKGTRALDAAFESASSPTPHEDEVTP